MSDSIVISEYIPQLKKILSFELTGDHIFFLNQYARFISDKTEIIFYHRSLYWDQRKDISTKGFLINSSLLIDSKNKQLINKDPKKLLEQRHRFGDNLYIPVQISEIVNIFHGHTPIPLAGSGSKESWKKVNNEWNRMESVTTWIS